MQINFLIISLVFAAIFIFLDITLFRYGARIGKDFPASLFHLFQKIFVTIRNRFSIQFKNPPPNKTRDLTPDSNSIQAELLPDPELTFKNQSSLGENEDNQDNHPLKDPSEEPFVSHSMPNLESQSLDNQSKPEKLVHVEISADIPEGTVVHFSVTVEGGSPQVVSRIPTQQPARTHFTQSGPVTSRQDKNRTYSGNFWPGLSFLLDFPKWIRSQIINWKPTPSRLNRILLAITVVIAVLLVSVGIDRYPIYFFTDEAIHMNLASDFLRDGYKNYFGEIFPTFFTVEGWVNGTSVYVQVLPYIIFGKSVIATRLVSAFISLLGAIAVSLFLKDALKLNNYWTGIFLVGTTPAWFLHARTAFEYVEVAAFYSIFLYFYSRYRSGHLRSLYWAILAGALSFYTHGLGQILMGVTGTFFFIIDFRYHIHPDRRKTILFALLLGIVLLLPFIRYYLVHPGEAAAQVKRRGSYWVVDNLSAPQKIGQFLQQYIYGLNPAYWYLKNKVDLNRHIMDGYGNGLWFTFPFLLIGLLKSIRNIRLPSYRIILIAFLVCPVPASVVAIGMPRMLWMTIPIALLTSLGILVVLQWLENRWRINPTWISISLFVFLSVFSLFMLRDALINGPVWFQDYSLYGMQYGAKQVFQDVVRRGLDVDPGRKYVVSPSWANGTEQFVDFFIPANLQSKVAMGQPIDFITEIRTGRPGLYFISTPNEYDKLINSQEFKDIVVHEIVPYPNGKPGFYVITLNVADNIEEILAAERIKNTTPIEGTMVLNDLEYRIIHSPLGSGRLQDVFDTDPDSLARVLEANPFTFDIYPATPIDTNLVNIKTGSLAKFTVTISLFSPGSLTPTIYTNSYASLPPDPEVSIIFDKGPAKSSRIMVEITDDLSGDTSQIHIRTIQFK